MNRSTGPVGTMNAEYLLELSALRAMKSRVLDEAKAHECVDAWATYGRAGAGMAVADYRKFVLEGGK